jgi:hypothetical protein
MTWPIAWRELGTLRDPERLRPWLVTKAALGGSWVASGRTI